MESPTPPTRLEVREAIDACLAAHAHLPPSVVVCESMHGYLRERLPGAKAIDVRHRDDRVTIDIDTTGSSDRMTTNASIG